MGADETDRGPEIVEGGTAVVVETDPGLGKDIAGAEVETRRAAEVAINRTVPGHL